MQLQMSGAVSKTSSRPGLLQSGTVSDAQWSAGKK
jgi:hypothetical protein